jgi:hypothetical protein
MADFYTMGHDLGCSSLFKPNDFFFSKHPEHFLEGKVQVPVFPLQDFLELLPLDQIEYIDYVKIDAQGADLQIVKGGVKGLQEKVVFLTLEADGEDYEQAEQNTEPSITAFMESIGFQKVVRPDVVDPTYVNTKFLHVADSVYICQRI